MNPLNLFRRNRADRDPVAEPKVISELEVMNGFLIDEIHELRPAIVDAAQRSDANTPTGVFGFITNTAERVGRVWQDYANTVRSKISELQQEISNLRGSLDKSVELAREELALANSKLTSTLSQVYTRGAVRAANRDLRIKELERNMRGLRIAIIGDPDADLVIPSLFIEIVFLVVALGVTAGIELALTFGLFQSESVSSTSLGISLAITLAGTLLFWFAARLARATRNYRDAARQLRNLSAKLGTGPLDERSRTPLHVEELSSDHHRLNVLTHVTAIGFALVVLCIRFFIILDKDIGDGNGEVLVNTLASASVVVVWIMLYIFERIRSVKNHPRLREYRDMADELDELTEERDDPKDGTGFLAEVGTAERAYAERCKQLKEPLEVLVRNLGTAQAKVREHIGWFDDMGQPACRLMDAYFALIASGLQLMSERAFDAVPEGKEMSKVLLAAYSNSPEQRGKVMEALRAYAPQWQATKDLDAGLAPASMPTDNSLGIIDTASLKIRLTSEMETKRKELVDAEEQAYRRQQERLDRRAKIVRTFDEGFVPPSQTRRTLGGAK